jgi:hypothetical protein
MTTAKDAMRSRMTTAATRRAEADTPAAGKTAIRTKDARITLNLPPSLLRDIERWALGAADTLVMPRVSTQNALRAMIRACLTDDEASSAALAQVRQETGILQEDRP